MPAAPDPFTLVVGDEELLVARALSHIVAAARAQVPDAELRELRGDEIQPGDLAEAMSPSLFGDDRVVVVQAAQDLSKEVAAELQSFAAQTNGEIPLVVVHAGGAKGKALLTSLLALKPTRVDAPRLTKPSERKDFVRAELRVDGREVDRDAVDLLLEAVGNDLRELASAASQLLSDTIGPITSDAVRRYYSGRAETTGFHIADRAVVGDLAGALELARWGQSTGLAPVLVISALAGALRSIGLVASAGNAPAGAIAARLGMPPWKVEQTQRQTRGWTPAALGAAMSALANADAQVKGEGADKDYAVEHALVAIHRARAAER